MRLRWVPSVISRRTSVVVCSDRFVWAELSRVVVWFTTAGMHSVQSEVRRIEIQLALFN